MAQTSAQPPAGLTRAAEEAGFYHEAALNASWTGARLAIGGLSFGFGAFAFAFFYLRSINSHGLWYPPPSPTSRRRRCGRARWSWRSSWSAPRCRPLVLQRIKAGHKSPWQAGALVALVLGLAAIGLQIWQLLNLPFFPGASGFASVFVGFWPVYIVVVLAAMIWLEILIMRSRPIPEISFVEQPPTYVEAFAVQRFQASLSAFTIVWNYLALVAIIAWVLFYLVH